MFRAPPSVQTGRVKASAPTLCSALPLPEGGVPDWVHLLPAGEARTVDGRGPYRVGDAAALMQASMAGGKLVLDENHATDLAAPRGESAPARGWIVELQSRDDGIWGKVEWTEAGRAVVPGYRGISPAIAHLADGTVTAIVRASLVNAPNLVGLHALHHQEQSMDFRKLLLEALGLDGEVDDAAIAAALKTWKEKAAPEQGAVDKAAAVALNAALAPIASVIGLQADADAAAVLAGVRQLKTGDAGEVVALQTQIATLTTSLNAVEQDRKRDKAVAYVDGAIAAGRVGVKPKRDKYIALHMRDAAECEDLVGAMPILSTGATLVREVPTDPASNPVLLAQQASAHQKKLAADGVTIDFATAVRAVQEGKAA